MKPINQSIILALIFLTVFITHFYSRNITPSDSRWTVHTAMSIIKEGNTDLDEYKELIGNHDWRIENIGGHIYIRPPIGTAIIALPFVFIIDKGLNLLLSKFSRLEEYIKEYIKIRGYKVPEVINTIMLSPAIELFTASMIIALTAVFIYLIGSLFLNRIHSFLITFIFAFCTSAWSITSRALWQHGPSILMLTITLYLILLAKNKPHLIQFVSIPLLFSWVIRPQNIISIFLLTIFVLFEYRQYFLHYFFWGMTIVLPFLFFNLSVYHSFLSPYYHLPRTIGLNLNFFKALLGNLISPGRGLFIFSPILLFSIVGFVLKMKNRQLTKLDYFLLSIILLHWIAISSYPAWWAGWTFGPRYLSDMIPYLIYFLIPSIHSIFNLPGIVKAIPVFIFFSLVIISFLIHYRGATDWDAYAWNCIPNNIDMHPERVWDWRDIQFLRGIGR